MWWHRKTKTTYCTNKVIEGIKPVILLLGCCSSTIKSLVSLHGALKINSFSSHCFKSIQWNQLTHSTVQLSAGLSWPPPRTLQTQLQSSRCSCLWHGKCYQNYTALEPAQPTEGTADFRRWKPEWPPVIIYLKYTDTRPARLHAGWQTILDVGLPLGHCAYQTRAVVAEHDMWYDWKHIWIQLF